MRLMVAVHFVRGNLTACGKDRGRYRLALTAQAGSVTCKTCRIVLGLPG